MPLDLPTIPRLRSILLASLLVSITLPATAAEDKKMKSSAFDHSDWTTVLEKFVDDEGMVDYQALAADRAALDRYIDAIESASPKKTPERFADEKAELAYYINAYNAHVFNGVLDRGPEEESVWSGGLISGRKFFQSRKIVVGGEKTNLKDLEEKVILGEYGDPRVHAALNCASMSCPRLRQKAYTASELDEQLDAAMREWVNDPAHVEVDRDKGEVHLNKIFDWFEKDFIGHAEKHAKGVSDANQIDYVNLYRDSEQQIPRDLEISFLDYDKGINAQ